ncbi:NAD(P)/FAD-dependent oxidoreductase [Salibacterium aidingense]|uniref:NAD(P)/FAD-dependent oxidoreductase n=1 Tax=Salibacterium aidingense TaxID=384933 RepID=UPI003BEDA577
MKVAIMGAGLSGLSCAIMLERNGITPTIFEKRSRTGDRFVNGEAFMSFLTKPIDDVVRYLAEEFQLYIQPVSPINRLSFHSENENAIIDAQTGFINIRGRHRLSLENQLTDQLQTDIQFHASKSYESMLREYTHVILAPGDASYAEKLRNFTEKLSVSLKGAIVEGEFDNDHVRVWLNNEIAPNGYAYLLPLSSSKANLVMAYPDAVSASKEQTEKQWALLLNSACAQVNQHLHVTDQFQITNYKIGLCHAPRIGNTFFTGNCFGAIMPFLGFGQFESILTGIYAAYDICGYGKYEDYTKPLRKSFHDSFILRRGMETLNNDAFNFIVKQLNGRIGERLFSTDRNIVRAGSFLLRPFVWMK